MYVCMYVWMFVWMYMCLYVCVCLFVCLSVYMYECRKVGMPIFTIIPRTRVGYELFDSERGAELQVS